MLPDKIVIVKDDEVFSWEVCCGHVVGGSGRVGLRSSVHPSSQRRRAGRAGGGSQWRCAQVGQAEGGALDTDTDTGDGPWS